MKTTKESISVCGFPKEAISKVMAKLEQQKINYLIIDTRNKYDVDDISDNKNLNRYEEQFKKSKEYVNIKRRIDSINEKLLNNMDNNVIKEILRRIEEILQNNES